MVLKINSAIGDEASSRKKKEGLTLIDAVNELWLGELFGDDLHASDLLSSLLREALRSPGGRTILSSTEIKKKILDALRFFSTEELCRSRVVEQGLEMSVDILNSFHRYDQAADRLRNQLNRCAA
jgi:hypothetical protein